MGDGGAAILVDTLGRRDNKCCRETAGGGADLCICCAVGGVSFRDFDNGLSLGPTGRPDSVGGGGAKELMLDSPCSLPFMRTFVWGGIKSRRIGSLQSWNG